MIYLPRIYIIFNCYDVRKSNTNSCFVIFVTARKQNSSNRQQSLIEIAATRKQVASCNSSTSVMMYDASLNLSMRHHSTIFLPKPFNNLMLVIKMAHTLPLVLSKNLWGSPSLAKIHMLLLLLVVIIFILRGK